MRSGLRPTNVAPPPPPPPENLFDRVHADDRGALRAQYQRVVRGEIPGFTMEYRAQHKDGSYRWMHASYVGALDDPLIGGIVVNSRDVTERLRLEDELRAVSSRERQRIGRDLHDGLGQELTGVALMLRGLARRLEAHCPEAIPDTQRGHRARQPVDRDGTLARTRSVAGLVGGGGTRPGAAHAGRAWRSALWNRRAL